MWKKILLVILILLVVFVVLIISFGFTFGGMEKLKEFESIIGIIMMLLSSSLMVSLFMFNSKKSELSFFSNFTFEIAILSVIFFILSVVLIFKK